MIRVGVPDRTPGLQVGEEDGGGHSKQRHIFLKCIGSLDSWGGVVDSACRGVMKTRQECWAGRAWEKPWRSAV